MSVKKINEENMPIVHRKVKRVPIRFKNFWERGLTVGKLKDVIKLLPNDCNIVVEGMDHTFNFAHYRFDTALFNENNEEINEDHGEDITPEEKYGKRKQVLIIS